MYSLPIKGWPRDVIRPLGNEVSDIIEDQEVEEFYIGRTNDLTAAKSRHGCDEIIALYETDNADYAIDVENVLIETFISDPKCSNTVPHGGGGVSDEYINYVYIALWYE